MTNEQRNKIKALIEKYNEVLLISMKLAVTEDFVNLILLNRDDKDFELLELVQEKEELKNFVMKEFLRKNSSSVIEELKKMPDQQLNLQINRKKKRP